MFKGDKGGRKLAVDRETALFLVLGLAITAWLKADSQLYFGFVAGLVGKTAVFNWGNAKEHEHSKGGTNAATDPKLP